VSAEIGPRVWSVLELLADGEFHSGASLAQSLRVSRATVFNDLVEVENFGVAVQRIRGKGYRLSQPWQPLDEQAIRIALADAAVRFDVEVMRQAASSNAVLLQRAAQGVPSGSVVAVELQTTGRGRLGRTWYSGLGNALTFSLLWRFDCGLNALSGLSLAVGLAIVRALQRLGVPNAGLKWPNDVLAGNGKLGGVLIEAQGDMLGPCAVVLGIGLNCSLPLHLEQRIDQAASALDQLVGEVPERNRLLAVLLQELAVVLDEFARHGFAELVDEWQRHHMKQDAEISLRMPDGSIVQGVARGVNARGELQIETGSGMQIFNSGEVGA
jgi:BirA family biotin operon repressor/biotin-[acetyl-CoA-carboxylase] ligase